MILELSFSLILFFFFSISHFHGMSVSQALLGIGKTLAKYCVQFVAL